MTISRILFLVFVFGFLLIPRASAGGKQAPPAGTAPKDFRLPERTTLRLQNGLRVTLVPYGKVPRVTARLVVRSGHMNEGPDSVWLADLTGRMMTQGTASLDASDLASAFARIGGSLAIQVGDDQTAIGSDALSEFAPDLVRLLADVARHPRFPASELERVKTDLVRALHVRKARPQNLARERFLAELYPGHPYGRVYPTDAMLRSYDLDRVRGFYDADFGARRTHLYVAGVFDPREIEAAIREAFADWAAGPEPLVLVPRAVSTPRIDLIARPGAPQSTLYLGLPVPDPSQPDYVPLQVTNALLGGSFGSRITRNIREEKGYTYSPRSDVAARYRTAYWVERADVTTGVTGLALREIFREIERLRAEPPSDEELDGIRNYLAGIFVLRNSSPEGIIRQLAFVDLHGLGEEYLTGYVHRVHAVSPEDVRRIADKYLPSDRMTLVVVGDRKEVEKQLAPFGTPHLVEGGGK